MKNNARNLDKFYTQPAVARRLGGMAYGIISCPTLVVEPSAGGGVFIPVIKSLFGNSATLCMDVAPEGTDIECSDYLLKGDMFPSGSLVIGNPPFGKNSSLAVKFFKKSAQLGATVIAFVLPRTFAKPRFWGRLDSAYVLALQEECPKNAFTLEGQTWNVPCVLQVWVRSTCKRMSLPDELSILKEVPAAEATHFIRRVGGRAGQFVSREEYTPSSTYAVTCDESDAQNIQMMHEEIRYIASLTAGVKCITLLEIEDVLLSRY